MALIGAQEPYLSSSVPAPGFIEGTLDYSRGKQAVAFCAWAGMTLFPWQNDLVHDAKALGSFAILDEHGEPSGQSEIRPAFPEQVIIVSRQNGKGEYLIGDELSEIYLSDRPVSVLHTAHYASTALKAQKRTWDVISGSADLMQWAPWVEKYGPGRASTPRLAKSNGKEAIEFPNGSVIEFRTRSGTQGAGSSNDILVLDECFDMPEGMLDALKYTTRARRDARIIWISSPVNRFNPKHLHGRKFSEQRAAGKARTPGIMFREWSLPEGMDPLTREAWIATNPSLITSGTVGKQYGPIEQSAMKARTSESEKRSLLVEDLGTGNWLTEESDDFKPIVDLGRWEVMAAPGPVRVGECVLAVEVAVDGQSVALVSAGQTARGVHLQVCPSLGGFTVDGTAAVIRRFVDEYDPASVILDKNSAAAVLVPALLRLGIDPVQITGGPVSASLRSFEQFAGDRKLTHDGDESWVEALRVATKRGEDTKFPSIERFSGEVSVLVAGAFASWGLDKYLSESGSVFKQVEEKKWNPAGAIPQAVMVGR